MEFRSDFNCLGVPLPEEEGRFRLLPEANRLLSQLENVDFVNGIFGAHVLKDAFVNLPSATKGTLRLAVPSLLSWQS